MGFGKSIETDQSPDSVLPAPHLFPDAKKWNSKPNQNRRDEILQAKEGFTEISFRRYRSSSRKNFSSRTPGMENKVELRRGSVYQSSISREVRDTKKPGNCGGRMKIELSPMSRRSDASISFRIVETKEERSARTNTDLSSAERSSSDNCLADSFIDICLNSDIKDRATELDLKENSNSGCHAEIGHLNSDSEHLKRLPKSFSAKLQSSRSPLCRIQKKLDPFVKSKSLRSPLGFRLHYRDSTLMENMYCKSSSSKFSGVHHDHSKNLHNLDVKCSPVYLHGRLKLENSYGFPVFQFSMDCTGDVYVAKTWKSGCGSSWVYTFHSFGGRKKSNASPWRLNKNCRDSLMVGQMQVSCFMCTEQQKDGLGLDNTLVTEFVLYDIALARRSSVSNDYTTDADLQRYELDDRAEENKPKHHFGRCDVDSLKERKERTLKH